MRVLLIAFLFLFSLFVHAQDTIPDAISDSITAVADTTPPVVLDTALASKVMNTPAYSSPIFDGEKKMSYDIEQRHESKNDAWIFFILLQLLIVLTVLKLAFSNDFDTVFKTFFNSNVAAQSLRTAKDDVTLSSLLMSAIFVTTMAVFTRFVLLHFYPHSMLRNNFSIVALIFLFTFFSFAKYAVLKYIGNIFEVAPIVEQYIFNLSAISRTIGICMIPILFILYASADKYFIFVLIISLMILCAGAALVVIRGLSTSYKLMYSSMYHFLIYICVGEILPVFLFIKLLTKTVI